MTTYDTPDGRDLAPHLVGRTIISVSKDTNEDGMGDGTLTLDDGTTLTITPNEGCGGCENGWYYLEHLEGAENIITSVETVTRTDDYGGEDVYELFVFTEAGKHHLATIHGDEGNGWYGYGFTVNVTKEDDDEAR